MSGRWLFEAIGEVGGDLIEEALEPARAPRRHVGRYLALAACLCLIVGGGIGIARSGWRMSGSAGDCTTGTGAVDGGNTTAASGGGADGADHDAAAPGDVAGATGDEKSMGGAYMSYDGPLLPLTVLEQTDDLTASRAVTVDLTGSDGGETALVTDEYVLTNTADTAQTVTLAYPFAASLRKISAPTLSVDGQAMETALLVGAYAGGFCGAGPEDWETGSFNLAQPDSWEDYAALLADGTYLERALADAPSLDEPVVVYRFSDETAPEDARAATVAIWFTIDPEKTTILTYDFNGCGWESETGPRQYSYFVREWANEQHDRVLVVLGEDIGEYALAGYDNGSCDESVRNDAITATVTRTETTLGALVDELCENSLATSERMYGEAADATAAQLSRAVREMLGDYGLLAGAPAQRYDDGRLDDLVSDTLASERVIYQTVEVTIPAGASVTVTAQLEKRGSFDYFYDDAREVVYGYDLATRLGSALTLTEQTLTVLPFEGAALVDSDLPLDSIPDVWTATLEDAREHGYFEVKKG